MLPKLISIGSFFIPTYGTLVAIGFLAALWIITRLAKRASLPSELITNLAIYCALAGLAGAKLFMILFDFQTYWNDPRSLFSLSTLQAAGVYQGGFLVAFVTAILYMRRQHLPILATCDVFAPGIALGQAIGRIGCFSAGCCWGIATHVPWAITFRNPQAADLTGVPLGVPLHPTQLYECVADALIFAFPVFSDRQDAHRGSHSRLVSRALFQRRASSSSFSASTSRACTSGFPTPSGFRSPLSRPALAC